MPPGRSDRSTARPKREAGGPAQLTPNVWTHLATTYDGSSLKLFVNAVQVASLNVSSSIVSCTGALKIGGNAILPEDFAGLIDEVRVYNRPLTTAELTTDMNTRRRRRRERDRTQRALPDRPDPDEHHGLLDSRDGQRRRHRLRPLPRPCTRRRTAATTATFNGLTCGTGYQIGVDAYDAAENQLRQKQPSPQATAACDPTGADLVAAYSFDEGSGVSVSDRSGSGNGGSVVGASWDPAGKFGKALSFDGAGDFVSVADSASLDLSTGMTLEAWVQPIALGSTWRTVIFKERIAGMTYALYANDDAAGRSDRSTTRPSGKRASRRS